MVYFTLKGLCVKEKGPLAVPELIAPGVEMMPLPAAEASQLRAPLDQPEGTNRYRKAE